MRGEMSDNNIQHTMQTLFGNLALSQEDTHKICKHIRKLIVSDLGTFLFDYYKNHVLCNCMDILFAQVCSMNTVLLEALTTIWNNFYTRILPVIQLILFPVTKCCSIKDNHMNIRELTLVAFRDLVLLKTDIHNVLHSLSGKDIHPAIQQMLLVLQTVQETCPPNSNYIALEALLALSVRPYLGYRGLYDGTTEPIVRSKNYNFVTRLDNGSADSCCSTYKQHKCRRLSTPVVTLPLKMMTLSSSPSPSTHGGYTGLFTNAFRSKTGRRYTCSELEVWKVNK